MLRSEFLIEFQERGFFHQCTNLEELDTLMFAQKIPAYIGFDATASSLHVGSLMQIMIFRLMQKHGHKPIILLGGGTTKVGDPSGKDETRKILTQDEIDSNKEGIRRSISKFVHFGASYSDAIMLDNAQWLEALNYIEFLRDIGRHFSVNRMLSFENVKIRLEREQNLSFLEFNYMILQAYDFVELNKRFGCRLQFGGSDQWGNIVNGIDLGHKFDCQPLYGLTTPLITTASGAKMGKTAGGAIWLNEDLLAPYDYYQFWRNTEDADVGRFLRMFTDLDLSEIKKLEALQDKEINEAKKILAFEATKLCHGEEEASRAANTATKLFEEGEISLEGLPSLDLTANEIEYGLPVFEALFKLGLAPSLSEARRLVRGKGVRINDIVVEDEMQKVNKIHLNEDNLIKISAGKKKHGIVRLKD